MRVALYSANVVAGDATGNSLLATLAALRATGVSARIYAPFSNVNDSAITLVDSVDGVRRDPFFRRADVHVFEFGWTYPLFDLLLELERPARAIVRFHGITPRALMPVPLQPGRDQTSAQLANATRAGRILAASEYARRYLVHRGIEPSHIQILPLPVRLSRAPRRAPTPGITTLLFVGRLVPSKGALDLLQALVALRAEGKGGWRLSVVTNPAASDAEYSVRVRDYVREAGLAPSIDHFGTVESREQLALLYASADAVIIPTYHDTYCLPLLEALASGCAVIAYASGAIPEIAGGLARLVPTADVTALTGEIARLFEYRAASTVAIADDHVVSRQEFERRAHDRTRGLTGESYDRAFLEIVRDCRAAASRPVSFARLARWWTAKRRKE